MALGHPLRQTTRTNHPYTVILSHSIVTIGLRVKDGRCVSITNDEDSTLFQSRIGLLYMFNLQSIQWHSDSTIYNLRLC